MNKGDTHAPSDFEAMLLAARPGFQTEGSLRYERESIPHQQNQEDSGWGLDPNYFNPQLKDKFKLIQDELDKPLSDFIVQTEETRNLFKKYDQAKPDFKALCEQGKLSFNNDFKITQIAQLWTIEHGAESKEVCQFGKVISYKNYEEQSRELNLAV